MFFFLFSDSMADESREAGLEKRQSSGESSWAVPVETKSKQVPMRRAHALCKTSVSKKPPELISLVLNGCSCIVSLMGEHQRGNDGILFVQHDDQACN